MYPPGDKGNGGNSKRKASGRVSQETGPSLVLQRKSSPKSMPIPSTKRLLLCGPVQIGHIGACRPVMLVEVKVRMRA